MPPPRTATPRRRARSRSPPHTACASGAAGTATRYASRPQHCEEVKCLVKIAIAQLEVAHRDRRREPVVEALRNPELRMERVPAGTDRQLVDAELARVEKPVHLDAAERALTELAELRGAVLLDVPRIARSLGALRREREHVRCRDVRDPARSQQRAEVLERGLRVLQVLDRLQEHERIARLRVG